MHRAPPPSSAWGYQFAGRWPFVTATAPTECHAPAVSLAAEDVAEIAERAGAGLSLGHQWILSKHLNLEASLGGGWARTPYRKYECPVCSPLLDESTYDYFGLTRATLSLTYFFN